MASVVLAAGSISSGPREAAPARFASMPLHDRLRQRPMLRTPQWRLEPRATALRRMKPAPFQYHAPKTIDETLDLLGANTADDDGRVIAGGQSLVPTMAFRLARPRHLVDINGVGELNYLEIKDGQLHIGAGVAPFRVREAGRGRPARALARDGGAAYRASSDPRPRHVLRQHRPRRSGLRMVRGRGRARRRDGGARASAAARALIPAREFFKGIMTTALREDELLTEVRLPILPNDTYAGFAEFSRAPATTPIAMAVATYRLKGGVMSDMLRIAGRRRGGRAAPHRRGRAHADRPPAESRHVPGRGPCRRSRRSIRSTTPTCQRRLPPRHRAHDGDPRPARTPTRQAPTNERRRRPVEMDRPVGRAAGGPAAGHRPRRASPATSISRASFTCGRALQPRARQHRIDLHRCGARPARRGRGVDRGRHRRRAADRFSRRADREARALPPAGAGAAQGALCRRADRGGVRRGPVCRRGRRRSRHHGGRGAAAAARRARRSRRVLVRPRHRGDGSASGLRRRRGGVQVRAAYRRVEAHQRPAFRRAAGDAAARSAATTPRATCWSCTAPPRCRTGTRN